MTTNIITSTTPTSDASTDPDRSPAVAWVTVARLEDLPRDGARVISGVPAGPIALFRATGDGLFAVHDRCPHKGGPLSQGIVHGESVTCPLHGWTIGLRDGCAAAPDVGCVRRFAVRVQGHEVQMDRHELARTHD